MKLEENHLYRMTSKQNIDERGPSDFIMFGLPEGRFVDLVHFVNNTGRKIDVPWGPPGIDLSTENIVIDLGHKDDLPEFFL